MPFTVPDSDKIDSGKSKFIAPEDEIVKPIELSDYDNRYAESNLPSSQPAIASFLKAPPEPATDALDLAARDSQFDLSKYKVPTRQSLGLPSYTPQEAAQEKARIAQYGWEDEISPAIQAFGEGSQDTSKKIEELSKQVPSGKELADASKQYGVPDWMAKLYTPTLTINSSLDKVALGLASFLTSPSGAAQTGALAVPVVGEVQALKFAYDMIKGGVVNVKNAFKAIQDKDWQAFSDNAVGAVANFGIGGKLAHSKLSEFVKPDLSKPLTPRDDNEIPVTIQRSDGTTYQALARGGPADFMGKQGIARMQDSGKLSDGVLGEDEKIVPKTETTPENPPVISESGSKVKQGSAPNPVKQVRMNPVDAHEFAQWARGKTVGELRQLREDHENDPMDKSDHAVEIINQVIAEKSKSGSLKFVPAGSEKLTEPAKTESDQNPTIIGMGGATPDEFNPNASRDVTGLADRVRKQREDAGKTEPTQPGQGIAPEASVERGKQLRIQGADPEKIMAAFESDGKFSSDGVSVVRAKADELARATNETEETFGTSSPEFKQAYDVESAWAKRTKAMQTEWAKSGHAQQGSVDIDTGTFSGLKRAYRDSHNGEDMPKEQEGQAKAMAEKNRKLAKENADLLKRISDEIEAEKVEPHVRIIADKLKGFFDTRASKALERIQARRAEGRLFAGIDPVELADYADYGASKILSKGIEGAEMTAEWAKEMADDLGDYIKPHLKQIWDASKATFEKEFTKIAGVGERAAKARKTAVKTDAEILEQKKARLEKVIAQKREQIKSGDVSKKVKTPTVTSPEIEELESERDQLDAQIRLMRDPDKFDSQTRASEKAKAAADKVVREAAARAAEAETRARVEAQKLKTAAEKEQQIAAEKNANAAAKAARRNAAKLAKYEAKKASDKAVRDRDLKQVQLDAAKKASDQASKTVRNAAIARAKLEEANRIKAASKKLEQGTLEHARVEFSKYKGGKMNADQVASLWAYVKKNYIDKGYQGFTEIVNKTATDLGLSFKDVANGLGQPKNLRKLTNELWRKQTESRRFSESAKRWVQQANTPLLGKIIPRFARFMFGAKTFGHGTVAFGTHAPMVAFMPKYSKAYFRDFGKMYKMVFSPAQYEVEVQALRSDPNFNTASRAGLVNDPYKVEDFNNPEMAQYFGRLSGAGNRGYFALKVLRQDMFNQGWNKLPESMKSDDMAKAMADDINHITGVVKSSSGGNKASLALFAPRLLMSRAAFLVGDPYKAVEIASTAMSPAKWKALPEHEKFIVKNQVKQKATILAVAYGLLQANQYMLQAAGSNQKVNLTDPTRSDFWKFKVAGMSFSFGNAMLNMARLPIRLWTIGAGDGGKLKHVIYPDESMAKVVEEFARSQASPISSLGLDFVFKGDYQNRPLPQIPGYGKPIPLPKRLEDQGIKPYTWKEYFSEQVSPIWAQEAEREVWRHGFGASDEQIKAYLKAAGTTIISAGTGGRVAEDLEPKEKKKYDPNAWKFGN